MLKTVTARTTLTAVLAALSMSAHAIADSTRRIDIPPGELTTALEILAKQSGVELIYTSQQVKGLRTKGVHGELTTEKAVTQLLEGTQLKLTIHKSGALLISDLTTGSADVPAGARGGTDSRESVSTQGAPSATEPHKKSFWDRFRLAQTDNSSPSQAQGEGRGTGESARASQKTPAQLQEVVVVGTQIRGVRPIGSVVELDRAELQRAGFTDVGEALRSLPGNFSGGINAETKTGNINADGAAFNIGRASSVNLFGIGSGATLVLLNGRRLPVGSSGLSVDVSTIPLSAVERIDVLADGASAVYGADAVAGVVNIVTRRDFEGLEARVRYGAADGGHDVSTLSSLGGLRAGQFSGVVGFEYSEQDPLYASERDRSRDADVPTMVIDAEDRFSAYFSGDYELTERAKFFVDGVYSHRTLHEEDTALRQSRTYDYYPKVSGYAGAAGVNLGIGETWTLDLFGTTAENISQSTTTFNSLTTGALTDLAFNRFDSTLWSLEARASGDVFQAPGGVARIAIGGAYRAESFLSEDRTVRSKSDRGISAVYSEVDIPLIGRGNRLPFAEELRVVAAARYEDDSEFGDVVTPKVGVSWRPVSPLQLSARYSKSFRAPSGYDRSRYFYTYLEDLIDGPATTRVLLVDGTGREGLDPETSKNLNIGVAYQREGGGLEASLDYFRIDYDSRIAHPDPSYAYSYSNLTNAPVQLIDRAPTPAKIQSLVAGAYFNGSAVPLDYSSVRAILDIRNLNISKTHIAGVQGALAYRMRNSLGNWDLSWDVTYLSDFTDQLLPGDAPATRVDTIYSPVDLRSRTGVRWSAARVSAALYWNYVDDYVDNRVASAPVAVDAWNTFDMSLGLDLPWRSENSGRGGTRLQLSVSNLLDASPPEIPLSGGPSRRYRWDPTNASIRGRFTSLELAHRW